MATSQTVKIIAVIITGIVIALTALIAALPLELPSKQGSTGTSQAQDGDTAWLLIATILGFFLPFALVYLYANLNGSDVKELIKIVVLTGSVVTFLWILFTFSLAYGKDAKSNGLMGYPATYYMFKNTWPNQDASLNGAPLIPNNIFSVYELGFALVTPTLIAASLAGRVNIHGFLLFICVWHIVVYTPVAHVVWSPQGAFLTNKIRDFSGGLVVHVLASATAISTHLVLGKDSIPKSVAAKDPEQVLFYTFIVWFLWFGFNAGKAHDASAVAAQSIVNTIGASLTAVLMGFLYNLIFEKPTTPVSISNSVIIGLIAITPASGYVTVGGAMIIAIFTYLFTQIVGQFLIGEAQNVNESLSILTMHGIAGTWGFLWTAILSYKFVNAEGLNGLTAGDGLPLAYQISGLLAIWGCALIASFFVAFGVNLVYPLAAVPEEVEYKETVVENVEIELTQA
jgi:Amt family ammonium transporter